MGNRSKEQTSKNERTNERARSEEVIIRSRRRDKKKGAKGANKVRGGQFYHTPHVCLPIEQIQVLPSWAVPFHFTT